MGSYIICYITHSSVTSDLVSEFLTRERVTGFGQMVMCSSIEEIANKYSHFIKPTPHTRQWYDPSHTFILCVDADADTTQSWLTHHYAFGKSLKSVIPSNLLRGYYCAEALN